METNPTPPRIISIIQARMTSSRLPGKVLMDIAGQPMLARVVERARRSQWASVTLVATSQEPADDPIARFCDQRAIPCYRGSLYDVLDRYYQAASLYQAHVIVRLTADCPLIDPQLIDQVIGAFYTWGSPNQLETGKMVRQSADRRETLISPPYMAEPKWDFAANRLPPPWKRTYPIGLDVEVCTFSALERAWREADQVYHREHVMPYLYDPQRSVHYSTLSNPASVPEVPAGFFRVLQVDHHPDYGSYRWTVDTAEDLALIRQLYDRLGGTDTFSWLDVLHLFQADPDLAKINAAVQHKTVQDTDPRSKAA